MTSNDRLVILASGYSYLSLERKDLLLLAQMNWKRIYFWVNDPG